jgi:hypothetical protein
MAIERPLQENVFWALEAIAEHVGGTQYALRMERETKPHALSPEYHLQAIADGQQRLWNRLAALLPDEYRASGNAEDSPA